MSIIIERHGHRKGSGGYRLDADPSDCVPWDGNVSASGYGRIWVIEADGERSLRYAHRAAWEAYRSPIPAGMTIDHLCVNPRCVNPDHLDLVTLDENVRRADERVTHCPRRHEYTTENTGRTSQGARFCRTCHRERVARAVPRPCTFCGKRFSNPARHERAIHDMDTTRRN